RVGAVVATAVDVDDRHATEQATRRRTGFKGCSRIADAGTVLRNAVDVRDVLVGAGGGRVRRHFDDFDVPFLRPVEACVGTVSRATRVAVIDEVNAGLQQRVLRNGAGLVRREDARAGSYRARDDRCGPYVELRQEQVEVKHVPAVLAFDEA